VNVSGQSIELRNSHRAALSSRFVQCSGKLRATVKSVGAFAGFNINEDPAQ
jgi:hypothetical protein